MAEIHKPPTLDLQTWRHFEKVPLQEATHKTFGVGVRRIMRNTVGVEVFADPPTPLITLVRVRTPNKTITLANGIAFSSLNGDLHIKQSETDETIVRTSGVIHLLAIPPGEHALPQEQKPVKEKRTRAKREETQDT